MRRALLIFVAAMYAFPVAWMVWRTTTDKRKEPSLSVMKANFQAALQYGADSGDGQETKSFLSAWWGSPFRGHLFNTTFLAIMGALGSVLSNAMAAYGFSRLRWPGRDAVFYISLSTMMLPPAATIVPLYEIYLELGWIGGLKPLWAPAWLGNAFGIFLLRQFMLRIPRDLTDAARIDGCNEWMIFARVIVPQSKPALIVVGLFHFLFVWNDFLGPLIYLTDDADFTLSLGLQAFASRHGGVNESHLLAAAVLVAAPVLIVFSVSQRFFKQASSMSGLKG
jgi:multiple sugar transport system permease protein